MEDNLYTFYTKKKGPFFILNAFIYCVEVRKKEWKIKKVNYLDENISSFNK